MADTGAPSGAPGASPGATRTSPAPGTFLRTTTVSAPPVPDNISVIHLRNSSRITDVLGEVPENLDEPVAEPNIEALVPTREEKSRGVVVEHGHHGVLAMLGVKPELKEKQVKKVGQMSEVNQQQSVEKGSQNIGQQISLESPKMKTLVNQVPSQPRPIPVPTLGPSFQSTVASQESTLKNDQKINDVSENNGNQSRQRGQSLEAQLVDAMEKEERDEITAVETEVGEEELVQHREGQRIDQVEEGIEVQMEAEDITKTGNDLQKKKQTGRISLPEEETEREGRLVETQQTTTAEGRLVRGNSDDQQGLIGLLAKSRLAPSSDSPSGSGERSDLEEQGDKVTDRVNSDLPLLPQLVGSVSDDEGPTKAESDPPTYPHNVTASTSTPGSSSTSSSRKAPQGTHSGDFFLVSSTPQGARTTQPTGFHTSGVSYNSSSLLSGVPREGVRPGGEQSEILEEDEGGDSEMEQKEELDNSEVLRVQLQPEDSILIRSLTGRPAPGQGVTLAVNQSGDEEEEGPRGDGDIEEPSLDKTDAHVKDILGEVWDLQEENLGDESHDDEGDYLDYGVYDEVLEPIEGFVPEEGSAGPVIEYQEFVSLNPPGIIRIPYNFTGLQMRELTEPPRVWNAREAFMEQVGMKLYMFIPAAAFGVILGIIIWVCFMFCLRVYGRFKQQLWGPTSKTREVEGLELKSPIDKNPPNWPSTTSSTSFDKNKVSEFNKSVVELVHQRRDYRLGEEQQGVSVSTTGPSSFQSSPKSISSGIGVSEKENFSDNVDEEDEEDAVKYGNPVNEGGPI